MKYTTDGRLEVKAGGKVIARSYVGPEVRVLRGMDRMETLKKIQEDCPEFLINNDWDVNRYPKLFSK